MKLEDYLATLWNQEKNLKKLLKPISSFQYVYFGYVKGNTFMHFTNNIQFLPSNAHNYECGKKWALYQVQDFIKEINNEKI